MQVYIVKPLITSDGQVVGLISPEDSALLGLQKWIKELVDLPQGNRLPTVLILAIEIAATEMGLYDCHTVSFGEQNEGDKKIIASYRETLINDIMIEIPHKLATLYSKAAGSPRTGYRLDDYSFTCRVRKELAIQFEEFCESTVPWFSANYKIPYFRCFDMRKDNTVPEDRDDLMVLLVDIHT